MNRVIYPSVYCSKIRFNFLHPIIQSTKFALIFDSPLVKGHKRKYAADIYFYATQQIMTETDDIIVPSKFQTIIRDFAKDLTTTFPEYSVLWKKWTAEDVPEKDIVRLFKYCTQVYPERFFDILYQNDEMFKEDSEINTRFLPAVEFRLLYNCEGVTETTRSAIWKYLQLILMNVVNSVRDKSAFGDAADIFEGVDESALQEKLNKTLEEIGSFFRNLGGEETTGNATSSTDDSESGAASGGIPNMEDFVKNFAADMGAGAGIPNMESFREAFQNAVPNEGPNSEMPNANDLHEHLKGLFDGKIGSLAKELAEEISQDVEHLFDEEGEAKGINTTGDLINKIIKNPKKIMSLMKTISGKLQSKMKSGEISEEEIMKEAGELMGKMKGMKGMGPMNEMFKNLAKGMGGAGGKSGINIGALQRMQKQMAAKERMRSKMEEKAESAKKHIERTEDPARAVFRIGEEDAAPEYSKAPVLASAQTPALNDEELVAMFSKEDTPTPAKKPASDKKKKANKK